MNIARIPLLALLTSSLLLTPAIAQESESGEAKWLTDFAEAKELAKKENKLVLANFTGSDWCSWCVKLKNEVFSKPEFASWAKDKVVLLELDFPRNTALPAKLKEQNDKLKGEYGIRGFPTLLFLDADGKEVGKHKYVPGGPGPWIAGADEVLKNAGSGGAATAAEGGAWLTNYEAALAQAKKEKKYVIANFTGSDWCGWCKKLKAEVFDQQEFKDWAKDNAVLLELDFPQGKKLPAELVAQNEKLAKQFRIEGYPSIVFLDGNGKELGRGQYQQGGPGPWIAHAEKESGIKSKKAKKPAKAAKGAK